ncbi:acyltransferase domain-containing protein [Lentzea alba]|uniref:type I polyketide synthase n=1 Tax=Lentzea alba TaxID=2714351 RepID=UPI0039BF046B
MTPSTSPNAVAVVGMACRYPKARDIAEYWANLRAGVEGITRFDPAELVARGVDPGRAARPDFVPAKGYLPASENFDWSFFGYSRAEAAGIDPQQRVFLECASAAVDDAGIDPVRFPGWIGVYAGADVVPTSADDGQSEMSRVIGLEKDFLATRVAYKLGLRGPAVTVQTACSTSLTATHMAVRSLLGYECDAALAGGVAVTGRNDWGYLYEQGGILSPDGRCRPFDAQAAGTVPSEGVGVVVLKRLEDALRDGDRIAAVILGSAINNDGADKMGYTAPSLRGQSEVVHFAQQVAGIDPADIDHVEAHGTATRIGDPVEVQALADVFGGTATGSCLLGAVKSNLGHTGAAAGVAGLIKTVLMLEHREIVPTLHYDRPNPLLDLDSTPFRVAAETQPWPDRGVPLAAVSAFGVGGTNAHVILQAAPERTRPAAPGHRVLALSAASPQALDGIRGALADRLRSTDSTVAEVARTLADRRTHRHRRAVVARDTADAARVLHDDAGHDQLPSPLGRAVFLLPGQGTLKHAAGAAAHRLLSGFRAQFDEIADAVGTAHGLDLTPVVTDSGAPEWFEHTVHQQVGLFALGCALGRQLRDWGVEPAALFGNSVGEYAAAVLAGVWTPADAASLVHERATAMWRTDPGVMAAVSAPLDEVLRRIETHAEVSVAVNGPGRVVLSGGLPAMEKLLASDDLHGLDVRQLATRRAFHSPAMDPAAEALRSALARTSAAPPRVPMISNETGGWSAPDAVTAPDYWVGQLLHRVQLADGAATLLAAGHDAYLELGPGTSMISTLRRHQDWVPEHTALPLLGGVDSERDLLRAVAALWERGVDGALLDVTPDSATLRCSLPPHPFAAVSPDVEQESRPTTKITGRPARTTLADLWKSALGVSSVAATDDFLALGGDSLMVVDLLGQVRELTGVAVSSVDFLGDATFGALTVLVGPGRAEVPAGVLAFGADRPGRPLFLAADAMGTALGYRTLAGLLDRPVYGLEPVGPVTGVERLAAQHVEHVLAVQPEGPYTVGGWSFGATVAHEMACQLTRLGAEVDVLVCLDGFVPAIGTPVGADLGHLAGGVRAQASALLGVGPFGRLVRRAPQVRRQFVGNIAALLRYRPGPPAFPAVLFRAGNDHRDAARLRARLSRVYQSDVGVHLVGGDHWSILADPHVHHLADGLRAALRTGENR